MSEHAATPVPAKSFWPSFLGVLGCFLIFGIILAIVYLPGPKGTPAVTQTADDTVPRTPEARLAKIAELKATEKKAATSYAVIDQAAGTYRLPIDRAMELVVAETAAKSK